MSLSVRWTTWEEGELTRLWGLDWTHGQIGRHLKRRTNAVAGKVHRMRTEGAKLPRRRSTAVRRDSF